MRIKTRRSPFPALLLALTFALLAAPALAAPTYGGGTGTQDDPFRIDTKEHLEALRGAVNAGTGYAGTYFKLTRDIDLGGTPWTPIGTAYTRSFKGNFDGDGRAITGLKVDVTGTGTHNVHVGLFGIVDGGAVSRLAVSGDVAGDGDSYDAYVGGIVGYLSIGTISGCSFTGTVRAATTGSPLWPTSAWAGGIVGTATGNLGTARVTGCVVSGASVVANATASPSSSPASALTACAGGIAGNLSGRSEMTDCIAADVSVSSSATGSSSNYNCAGGVLGASVDSPSISGNVWYGNAAHAIGRIGSSVLYPTDPPSDAGAAKVTGPFILILTAALPDGTAGTWLRWEPFRAAPTGATVVWSAKGLPKGLEIDRKTGVISGIPEKTGTYDVEVTATSGGQSATRSYPIVIYESQSGRFAIDEALPEAFVRQSYRHELSTAGGKAASWKIEDGALPKGMKFNEARGRISGTPRKAGDYAFVVTAEKTDGTTASRRLTLKVLDKGTPGATLKAVGVPTAEGMAEVLLSGTAAFELGSWFDADGKPVTPESLTVIVDGEAQTVSVTNGRFTLPATEDAEYELWVEAALPDGSTLKSDALYVVAGRGTLTAPDLKASPESAKAGERVTFDLGEWLNKREPVEVSDVRWLLNGVDVTEQVLNGKLTVEAIDGGGGKMTLTVTGRLPNGLEGRATATVTIDAGPAPGPGGSSGGGCDAGLGALAVMAMVMITRRKARCLPLTP